MKYLYIIRASLLELLEYRTNLLVRSVNYGISLSFNLFLWLAVFSLKGDLFGYSRDQMIMYYVFLSLVIPLVNAGVDFPLRIGWDIKNGDLNKVLTKPIEPLVYYGAYAVSQRLKDFVVLAPLTLVVAAFFGLTLGASTQTLVTTLLFLVLAFCLSHLVMGIVGVLAFWTTEINWASNLLMRIIGLFSGVQFPLNFFPPVMVGFLSWTPLYYLFFLPVALFLGKSDLSVLPGFVVAITWVLGLLIVFLYLWKRGVKRYEGVAI